ncbi:HD-GYP domain-containing protein [Treponema sp.]|uniref:HD-GYP domain-containing protein n=1 Tax=Treponema sp. TaxID=166 RepID=UPI003F03E824
MDKKNELLSEMIPFFQELLPGLSLPIVVFFIRAVFFLFLFAGFSYIVFGFSFRLRNFISSRSYLKKLSFAKHLEKFSPDQSKRLLSLVRHCVYLGSVIDSHTNRKGKSRQMSIIVYRLLKKHDHLERIIFTAAAMVYDAGFLEFPQSLFHSELLTRAEISFLRTHVARGLFHFGFVPKEYREVFYTAAFFHHENQDGGGFPEELKSDEIPYVARVIHLVEDYVSLVRQNGAQKALSSRKALAVLKKSSAKYDPELLSLLEKTLLSGKKSRPSASEKKQGKAKK